MVLDKTMFIGPSFPSEVFQPTRLTVQGKSLAILPRSCVSRDISVIPVELVNLSWQTFEKQR